MKGTGNEARPSEARRMVEEHREKDHHMVEKHHMGSVPRTPAQPRGGEPKPHDKPDGSMAE